MKGIVLEIRGKTAAVLREDGVIVTIRQKCAVGDTIELKAEKVRFPGNAARNIAAAAAVFVLVGAGGGGYMYQNVSACSYVSLDVNPSMEFVLNRRNRVIEAAACDDDAENIVKIINDRSIKNMEITEAVETACEVMKENGYLGDEETNYILLNVSSDQDIRKEELTEEIMALFDDREGVEAVATESSVEDRNKARDLGVSPGMYQEIRIIEKNSTEGSPEINAQTIKRYKGKTVRECMQEAGQIPSLPEGKTDSNGPEQSRVISSAQNGGTVDRGQEAAPDNAAGQAGGTLTDKAGYAGVGSAAGNGETAGTIGTVGNGETAENRETSGNPGTDGNEEVPQNPGTMGNGGAPGNTRAAGNGEMPGGPGTESQPGGGVPGQMGMPGGPN